MIGPRRRRKSKSESEYLNPPVTKNRLGSMLDEIPVDCLVTPTGRSLRGSMSQPDMTDVFLETPLGLGSSTRLESGIIHPNWEAIDKDIAYLEGLSARVGSTPSTLVKLGYERILTTLIQTERQLQVNGQFGDTLDVDYRKDRLYKTKRFREVRPIHYGGDRSNNEDYTVQVVGGADSLTTVLDDEARQNIGSTCVEGGDNGQTTVYCNGVRQNIGSTRVEGGDNGQTTTYSNEARQNIGSMQIWFC